MLEIVNNKQIITIEEARNIEGKAIFVLTDIEDINNLKGYLYAVSKSINSFEKLNGMYKDQINKGINCMVVGSYEKNV